MKKTKILLLILCVLSFFAHLLLVYPKLPDIIPTSWGFDGTVNGYSGKGTSIFLALLPALMLLLLDVIPKIDPRSHNYAKHQKAYQFFMAGISLLLIVTTWVSNFSILGYRVNVSMVIQLFMGILFLIIGNFMPQIHSNYTFGIKTPWAIENEYVWKKTHQAGGIVFCIMGLLFLVSAFFTSEIFLTVIMICLVASSLGLYLYSYLVYRQIKPEKKEESEDSPSSDS